MELRRTANIIALAVVSYLLFLAWMKDYGNTPASTSTSAPVAAAASGDVPALPAPAPKAAANGDVPVLPTATALVAAKPVAGNALVQVHSDVLNFTIDPRGGDIVSLNLPKYTTTAGSQQPFQLLQNDAQRVYEAQSGLIGTNGPDGAEQRPLYTTAQTNWTLGDKAGDMDVVLSLPAADGVQIDKIFHVTRGSYLIKVSYHIVNHGAKPWSAAMYGQLKRDSSKDPSASQARFGMSTFLGGVWWSPEKHYNKLPLDKFNKDKLELTTQDGWIAMVQHYFLTAWIPNSGTQNAFSSRTSADGSANIIGFTSAPVQLTTNQQITLSANFYAGPKVQEVLRTIATGLDLTVDYGWLWFIAKLLFWLLTHIQMLVGNWGWSIILLTLLVKAVFFPLSAASYRSMAKMRLIMPEMQRIKEQYGDDRAKMGQATMELYRKEKINPLGGCLPILVQMPVFIALYWTLMESVELRHATFFWLKDLSVMDPFFVLPIIMGGTMLIQQRLNPPPQDPMQAKVLQLMPIFFTFMFLWFPAGLVLYWVVNNMLSIAQQAVITRQIGSGR